VWEKGQFVPGAEGLTAATAAAGSITFQLGSGRYSFRLTGM